MPAMQLLLRVLTAAGLAVDAWVHADLAHAYAGNGKTITQGDLFLVEAAVASAAALVVLVVGRWPAAVFALVVAASALAAIMLYRYVNVGAIGPLPNMYEPLWFTEKTVSAVAEAVATVSAAALVVTTWRERRLPRGDPGGLPDALVARHPAGTHGPPTKTRRSRFR